jgi:hypothetical protein
VRAEALAVLQVDAVPGALALRFDRRTPLEAEALLRVARERPGSVLLPDGLRWPLEGADPMDSLGVLLDRLQAAL